MKYYDANVLRQPLLGHRADTIICDDVSTPQEGSVTTDYYAKYLEQWMQEWYDGRRRELLFGPLNGKTRMATGLLGYLQSGEKKQHVWGSSSIEEAVSMTKEFNKRFINHPYKEGRMIERCPFCGEAVTHKAVVEHLTKKGWKQRVTQVFECGTIKVTGNWKVKGPRVTLGKKCTKEA